jgi:hypothetical protein
MALVAVLTSLTRARAASLAGAPSARPSWNWRPDDLPSHDPGADCPGRRCVPAVAVGAHSGAHPETRTRNGGKCMNGHSTKPGPLTEPGW